MKPSSFEYVAPRSLDEAIHSLTSYAGAAKVLAGGQSLVPLMNLRLAAPEVLIDIVARFRSGDEDGARDVFYRHLPLIRFENQPGINLPLRKHLYRRRGAMASERARSPVAPLDVGTKLELDRILQHLGLADGLGPIEES